MASTALINAKSVLPFTADKQYRPVAVIGAATNLTAADTGRTFIVSKAAAYAITLPAAAPGLNYTFISGAVAANLVSIGAASAATIIYGTWRQISGVATVSGGTATVNFTATSVIGDEIRIMSDGMDWYVKGDSGVAGGISFV
jgi:PPE-repeat protein